MRITFKRQANETGLARVCQSPRGYELRVDKKQLATVYPLVDHRTFEEFCEYMADLWSRVPPEESKP